MNTEFNPPRGTDKRKPTENAAPSGQEQRKTSHLSQAYKRRNSLHACASTRASYVPSLNRSTTLSSADQDHPARLLRVDWPRILM